MIGGQVSVGATGSIRPEDPSGLVDRHLNSPTKERERLKTGLHVVDPDTE